MSKVSLDHLRKGGVPRGLPERAYSLCLRRDLLARVDALTEQLRDAMIAEAEAEDAEGDPDIQPPARLGQPAAEPRSTAIRAELNEAYDEMDDATGELRLRAIRDGDWRQWVNAHPPRPEHKRDQDFAYGLCNADDLADDLSKWVTAWDGEPLAADDWSDHLAPLCSGGDLKALVALVLQMQEAVDDPKLRRLALHTALTNSGVDSRPEPSADPSPSTSDESRPSDMTTTTPTTT